MRKKLCMLPSALLQKCNYNTSTLNYRNRKTNLQRSCKAKLLNLFLNSINTNVNTRLPISNFKIELLSSILHIWITALFTDRAVNLSDLSSPEETEFSQIYI